MKRLFAITLLAAFAAAPSVTWLCEQNCGAEHPGPAAEDCHRSDEAAQVVLEGQRCGDHALPVALVTKRVQAGSDSFVSPRGAALVVLTTRPVAARLTDFTFADSSPPRSGLLVPLRI